MEKIENWLNKHGMIIIICILLLCLVNQCSIKNTEKREAKYQKELVEKQDSVLTSIETKLDSTLISNGAVIDANKKTSDAINNKKQNIVIKVDKK